MVWCQGLVTARSWVRLPPVAAVYQRQLSVPSLRAVRGRLMSTSEKLGSKRAYHAMHWPQIRGLVASAGVRLRAKKMEISVSAPPHGPSAPPSGSPKCLRFGHWPTLCTINIYLLTYLLTYLGLWLGKGLYFFTSSNLIT